MPATTTTKEKPVVKTDEWVLFQYDPSNSRFGVGSYSEAVFKCMILSENNAVETLSVRPGVQKMEKAVYEKWRNNKSPEIVEAFRRNVLRLVSAETDINKIGTEEDTYEALQIIQNTQQISLLREWMKTWDKMAPAVLEAMKLKQENMEAEEFVSSVKTVFGQKVPT